MSAQTFSLFFALLTVVWIAYRPDLRSEQVEHLREVTSDETLILTSPLPDLPAPVILSGWGWQLRLDHAADPRLEQFVETFVAGPQTPAPRTLRTGGIGAP